MNLVLYFFTLSFQLTEEFEEVPVQSRGFGILDVGYRSTVKISYIHRVAYLLIISCV